jgi:hypothetical protein
MGGVAKMIHEPSEEYRKKKYRKYNEVKTRERVNISVSRDVFEEFSFQARKNKRTLFSFANDSLLIMAKISSEGGNPTEVYRIWRSLSLIRTVDTVTLPLDLVDEIISKLYVRDRESLMSIFRDAGSRLAALLKFFATDFDEFVAFIHDVSPVLPLKQINIIKKDTLAEFHVLGAGRRIETTECFFEFLRSIIECYGYGLVSKDVAPGTILATVKRRSE